MNKKLLSLSVLTSALILSANTFAKPQSGGFYGPTAPSASVTVAEVQNLKDESFVVLKGSIKQMVGKEKYLFEDKTGSIVVEIDDDDWEKEIMQQLNRKRTSKTTSKKQNTNIFGKLFKDKKDKNNKKSSKK